MPLSAAIDAWRAGELVLCCAGDGASRRGDLALAAEHATPEALNTMLRAGGGLLCLALDTPLFDRLELRNIEPTSDWPNFRAPAATATIEAAEGITTGISCSDRAHTIAAAIDRAAGPASVVQPGHVPVLRATSGGLRERQTPVEGAVQLARRAGTIPAAVLCEALDETGELAGLEHLPALAAVLGCPVVHLSQLAP